MIIGQKLYGTKTRNPIHSTASRQQLDPSLADSEHVNGFSCWHCRERSYADCQSRGQLAYCQDEQFHCYLHEKRQYGDIVKIEMGCKQDDACHNELGF